jgi:cysteine-rich repeat protein
VDALSLVPAETTIGHSVTVTASATDIDQGPSPLSYSYSTSSGSITSGMGSPVATVSCTVPGPLLVTLTVSDGDCTDTATETITCTSACGDGYVDTAQGEACDDGNTQSGDGCSSTCQLEDNPSTPGDDRAGYVKCGYGSGPDLTCGPGTFCCIGSSGSTFCATTGGTDCPDGVASQSCDGPEDCPANTFCAQYHSTACVSKGAFFYNSICHVDADCASGMTCSASGDCPSMSGPPI